MNSLEGDLLNALCVAAPFFVIGWVLRRQRVKGQTAHTIGTLFLIVGVIALILSSAVRIQENFRSARTDVEAPPEPAVKQGPLPEPATLIITPDHPATIAYLEAQLATPVPQPTGKPFPITTIRANVPVRATRPPSPSAVEIQPTICPQGTLTFEQWLNTPMQCLPPDQQTRLAEPFSTSAVPLDLGIPCDTFIYNKWKNGKSDQYAPECTPTPHPQ